MKPYPTRDGEPFVTEPFAEGAQCPAWESEHPSTESSNVTTPGLAPFAMAGEAGVTHWFVLTMSIQTLRFTPTATSASSPMPASNRRKDDVIQIRASAEAKALLNRAAAMRGQKLSEFMLDSARREAEETILDQRAFFLDDEAHARFLAVLDAPPKPSAQAQARLKRKAPWVE
jgi:uncharacterized protein (DUF1778 family)